MSKDVEQPKTKQYCYTTVRLETPTEDGLLVFDMDNPRHFDGDPAWELKFVNILSGMFAMLTWEREIS